MRYVVGIDLSGPSNTADTVVGVFAVGDEGLVLERTLEGASDDAILDAVTALTGHGGAIVVGVDAPLSYNAGGGDRPGDARIRRAVVEAGLPSGAVMTPTMTRMAYLTLRGIVVARLLAAVNTAPIHVVEVHPGAALVLRGAPHEDVVALKRSADGRRRLAGWLCEQGVCGLDRADAPSDHCIAAGAAALAAWRWCQGRAVWIERRCPPHHPYDFAC